jgi:hypothetical protein
MWLYCASGAWRFRQPLEDPPPAAELAEPVAVWLVATIGTPP